MDGALEHKKKEKKVNVFFFLDLAMMSNFRGCFEVDFGLSLLSVEMVVSEMSLG